MTFPVQEVVAEIRKRVVGQDLMVERLLIGLLTGGHVLLEGVPGLAKTLTVHTLADVLHASFSRIQFTPDLLPADVVGTMIFESQHQKFTVRHGPIFAQIVLADEVNRAPAKVQSALLEAMQELACTVRGNNYKLDPPFFVLATQNPIELEGTYPLPEAQLDRFLFNTVLGYLTAEEELQVVDLTTTTHVAEAAPVTDAAELLQFQQLVRMTPIAESVARYVVDMVRVSRPTEDGSPDFVKKYVNYGASVRAAQFLVLAGKARALMHGRYHVTYEDVRSLYVPVLRHRILLNFHAESDRMKQDDILKKILEWKAPPRE